MAAEPQPWASRPPDDVLMEPEKFLADLGWSRGNAAPVSRPKPALVERKYCSFCWAVLTPEAGECHDCGHSVAEMEADRQARAVADRAWTPPRMWTDGRPPAPAPAAAARRPIPPSVLASRAAQLPLPPQPIQAQAGFNWRHVVLAIGAGGFVGGATVAAIWVGLQTLGRPARAQGPSDPASGALVAVAPATVTWKNPVAELKASLVSSSGVVVAQDVEKQAATIEPGEYRLRMSDVTGKWAPPEERVTVGPAETVTLGPSPRVVAGYYLWAGKKLYEDKKTDRAERVWAKAVQHYPEGVEARLQLAALMAVRFRYKEARQQALEVLKRTPGNAEAQRIIKALDQLEASP